MIWGDWLRSTQPLTVYSKFQHFEYIEDTAVREQVAPTLAEIVYRYHTKGDSDEQSILRELRYLRTAAVLQIDQRPQLTRARRGNFAEILACEFTREVLGYAIPVNRLHFNPNIEQSMKGDDILGFKFKEDTSPGYSVLVGEAKFRKSFTSTAVEEAYEAIKRVKPYPASMEFTSTVLRSNGNDSRAEQVDQIRRMLSFGASAVPVKRLIALVTVGRPRNPFDYIEQLSHVVGDLIAVNISLGAEADKWIDLIYETDV